MTYIAKFGFQVGHKWYRPNDEVTEKKTELEKAGVFDLIEITKGQVKNEKEVKDSKNKAIKSNSIKTK